MPAATTTSVRRIVKWRDKSWNCTFTWVNSCAVQQTVKGRKFIVDGVEMELFPTGALCKVLERNHRCLYKWEKNFNFPAALWRFRDLKTVNRWYSKNQLIAILTVIEALGWLKGKNRNKLPAFIKAVRAVFYKVDQPTVARNDK